MFFKQRISLRWAVLENANTIYYFLEKKKKKNPGTYFKFFYYDTEKQQMEFGYK